MLQKIIFIAPGLPDPSGEQHTPRSSSPQRSWALSAGGSQDRSPEGSQEPFSLHAAPVSTWEAEDYFTMLTFFNLQLAPRAAAALQTALQYFVFPVRPSEGTHSQEQPPGPP